MAQLEEHHLEVLKASFAGKECKEYMKFIKGTEGFSRRRGKGYKRWARKHQRDPEQLSAEEHKDFDAHRIWKEAKKVEGKEDRLPKYLSRAAIMEVMKNVVKQANTVKAAGYLERVQGAALTWTGDEVVAEQWKEAALIFTHMRDWIKTSGKSEVDEGLARQLVRMLFTWEKGAMRMERGQENEAKEKFTLRVLDIDAIRGVE